ncbi:hypothetical protein RJT34_15547 [Clitoria ternatea]|uniref:ARID domain-containing protein n=1 Tax=Clitoria ternatea TaxID=43366 RepID=A0AAN9J5M1_CLITE
MLGNDVQRVDLHKLFLVVKGKGGYDAVCNGKLWDLVAEESGLGMSVGSSVELVYSKYLSGFDAWLKKKVSGSNKVVSSECGLVDDRHKFVRCLMELQDEVKGLFSEVEVVGGGEEFKEGFDDDCIDAGSGLCSDEEVRNGGCRGLDMPDVEINLQALRNLGGGNDVMDEPERFDGGKLYVDMVVEDMSDAVNNHMPGLFSGSKNEKCNENEVGGLVLGKSDGGSESSGSGSSGGKRKRESVLNLLNWVTGIAKNPCDPEVGSVPEKSKWKSSSNVEVWKQLLSFREAAFPKRHFELSSERRGWQSQKMHPCMYDDQLGASYNLRERLKRDKKLLFGSPASAVRSSSESSVGTEGHLDRTPSPHTEDRAEKRSHDSSDAHSVLHRCATVRIPVGMNHQAEIPEWIGMTSESDSKWLGTRMWPSEKVNSRLLIERDPIGKGRQDSCGCSVPGSVECVRFHISEKRAKVKLELGAAFYDLNFDKVGEDVRQLWTKEEEKNFENVVRANPSSLETYFWDHIFKAFPKKSREDLVSYYFNVFLLQRRGYQNRHTPDKIDSDDDESESVLRNVFGHQNQVQSSRSSILLTPKKSQARGK